MRSGRVRVRVWVAGAGAVVSSRPAVLDEREADLAARWADGIAGPLRLEDGRPLKIVFPGVAGGSAGPDFRGAILDAGGDLLRGDVEIHLETAGWRAHGHHRDPAYAAVVLHVVGRNESGARQTLHAGARAIPILVLPPAPAAIGFPPPFTPPCALFSGQEGAGPFVGAALERLGMRRLRIKAARAAVLVASQGAGQALYALMLEQLGGSANREPFAAIARRLPLAALLERAEAPARSRQLALSAELKGAARTLVVRRAGLRPMAEPGKRLEAAAALMAAWWPAGAAPGWPEQLNAAPDLRWRPEGIGRATLIEIVVNGVFPVALGAGLWSEDEVAERFRGLPSPGTYGRLRPLERWLAPAGAAFPGAARLQGGLLLHADYCTKGGCGRCPLSS